MQISRPTTPYQMQDPADDWGKKDQSTSQVFLDLFLGDNSFCLLGIAKSEFSTLLQTNPDDATCQKTYLDVKINKHLAIQDQIQRSSFCSVNEMACHCSVFCIWNYSCTSLNCYIQDCSSPTIISFDHLLPNIRFYRKRDFITFRKTVIVTSPNKTTLLRIRSNT